MSLIPRVKVDARAIAKWAGRMRGKRQRVPKVAASTLNYIGDKAVMAMAERVAAQTGMPIEAVRRSFVITRASEANLSFIIDAKKSMTEETSHRPMPSRDSRGRFVKKDEETFFREGELVNIIDMGDERVCPICERLVEDGPYTIEEARRLVPAHPNCRCVVDTLERRKVAPIEFRNQNPSGFRAESTAEPMSEILAKMRGELQQAMRSALR
jgi:hypothetical protein